MLFLFQWHFSSGNKWWISSSEFCDGPLNLNAAEWSKSSKSFTLFIFLLNQFQIAAISDMTMSYCSYHEAKKHNALNHQYQENQENAPIDINWLRCTASTCTACVSARITNLPVVGKQQIRPININTVAHLSTNKIKWWLALLNYDWQLPSTSLKSEIKLYTNWYFHQYWLKSLP